MKKKLFVFLLSALCICSLVSTVAFAASLPTGEAKILYEQNFDNLADDGGPVPVTESNFMKAEGLTVHGGSFCQVIDGRVAINGGRTATEDKGTGATVYGLDLDADQIEISIDFLSDPDFTVSSQLQVFPYAECTELEWTSAFLYAFFDIQNFDGAFVVLHWTSESTYDLAGRIPFDGQMHTVSALIDKATGTYSILIDGKLSDVTDVESEIAIMPLEAVGVKVVDFNANSEAESMLVIDNLVVKAYGAAAEGSDPVVDQPDEGSDPVVDQPDEGSDPVVDQPDEGSDPVVDQADTTADGTSKTVAAAFIALIAAGAVCVGTRSKRSF